MIGMDFNVALSGSASSGANAGAGDFNIFGGGAKQQQTLYIALAVVAVAGLAAWFVLRRK